MAEGLEIMTEKEIADLATKVLDGDDAPKELEIAHWNQQLPIIKSEIYKVKLNFRMWKFAGDTEKMLHCEKEIKRLRDLADFITKRLAELNA